MDSVTSLDLLPGWPFARLRIAEDGRLLQLPAFAPADFETHAPAYPPAGNGWILEPALRVIHANGDTSGDLRVVEAAQEGNLTTVVLRDPVYPFEVTLSFLAHPEYGIVEQWATIVHEEEGPVTLTHFASSFLTLFGDSFHLTQFHGDWGREATVAEEALGPGIKILDSKAGVRTNQFRLPGFLLSVDQPLDEEDGKVLAGTLAWPGNFQFLFEREPAGEGRRDRTMGVRTGMNPFGSEYRLRPEETFMTPRMVWCVGTQGAGEVSRRIHRWARTHVIREGDRVGPILLNNWEATYFNFDAPKLHSLFEKAADLGFETFLLDDGWFGRKYPRNDDTQGLGDWMPIQEKIGGTINDLALVANQCGVRFGIWVEPEMVNPKSELYEAHPDWVIVQRNRDYELRRHQLNLDLSNPEVEEYVFSVLDTILSESPNVDFVKWDCNRYVTQPGSFHLAPEDQSSLFIRYPRAILRVFQRLASKHPVVQLMLCSGGGGRVDYGSLAFAHEFWASDMTDPLHRVDIQWGYSYLYPARVVAAHVTRWGERPIKFGVDVALSGRFGVDLDLDQLSPEETETLRRGIETAKAIRDVVQLGDQYRLLRTESCSSVMFVSPDQERAIVFVYPVADSPATTLRLKGLLPEAEYDVREINGETGFAPERIRLGDDLLIPARPAFASLVLELEAI